MKITRDEFFRLEKSFHQKYKKISTGCWIWTAGTNTRYGLIGFNKRGFYAHRVSWVLYNNKLRIPKNKEICHSCDVPLCVNPEHLWLGTRHQNVWDSKNKGRAAIGDRHGRRILNSKKVIKIKKLIKEKIYQKDIAKKFGVTREAISLIARGINWGHVSA